MVRNFGTAAKSERGGGSGSRGQPHYRPSVVAPETPPHGPASPRMGPICSLEARLLAALLGCLTTLVVSGAVYRACLLGEVEAHAPGGRHRKLLLAATDELGGYLGYVVPVVSSVVQVSLAK